MPKTVKMKVVAYHTDNGDGSTTVQLFNNREELKADLADSGYGTTLEDVEKGDDPYRHGTLTENTLLLAVDDDGNVSLAAGVSFTSDG